MRREKFRWLVGFICLIVSSCLVPLTDSPYWWGLAVAIVSALYVFVFIKFELPKWRKK